jgi:hypothetical protein
MTVLLFTRYASVYVSPASWDRAKKLVMRGRSLMQCSVHCNNQVQCSAVQCSAVQCSAVQCSAVQCSAVRGRSLMQCSVHCNNQDIDNLPCTSYTFDPALSTCSLASALLRAEAGHPP